MLFLDAFELLIAFSRCFLGAFSVCIVFLFEANSTVSLDALVDAADRVYKSSAPQQFSKSLGVISIWRPQGLKEAESGVEDLIFNVS